MIPHPGDIDPWDRRLSGEKIGIDGSDRFPDLDKAGPSLHRKPNRRQGHRARGERGSPGRRPGCHRAAHRRVGSQRNRFGKHVRPDRPLQRVSRNDIYRNAEKVTELPGDSSEADKPDTVIHVDKEVDVTPRVIIAPSDTAKDTDIADPPPLAQIDHGPPVPAEPAAERRIGQPEPSTRQGLDVQGQLVAGRFDQLRQHRHPGLSAVRLISTDHRLGDTCPPRQVRLGQPRPAPSITDQLSWSHGHGLMLSRIVYGQIGRSVNACSVLN